MKEAIVYFRDTTRRIWGKRWPINVLIISCEDVAEKITQSNKRATSDRSHDHFP